MNKVSGKIIVKETGIGIPDLLVVIYDIDPEAQSGEFVKSTLPDANFWNVFQGDRLGSVLTNELGKFELHFEDQEFIEANNNDKRPDIVLFVMGPEETASEQQNIPLSTSATQQILHYSYISRANAGRTENYIIRFTEEQLQKAGIPFDKPLDATSSPASYVASIRQAWNDRDVIQRQLSARVKTEVKKQEEIAVKAKQFVANLGGAPVAVRQSPFFVASGDSLDAAVGHAVEDGLRKMTNYKGKLSLRLTESELSTLGLRIDDGKVKGPKQIQHTKIMQVLAERSKRGETVTYERAKSLIDACRETRETEARLEKISDGSSPTAAGNGTTTSTGDGELPTLEETILARVREQVQNLGVIDLNGIPRQSDPGTLQKTLAEMEFSGGPADVASYHDFHTLQIAFRGVWTSAFDARLKDDVESLYREIVRVREELGLDTPAVEAIMEVNDVIRLLQDLGLDMESMEVLPIPSDVGRVFPEITLAMWLSLSASQQRDVEIRASLPDYYEGLSESTTIHDEVGRILANPQGHRGRAMKLMLNIGDRLSEKYTFDVFAPNSYNFGIILTYRQKWQPLTYQVGDLVSTIPLAPGETRKFTKKRVVKTSREQKEIEKSLTSRKGESSQTTRAEAEILRKASSQTNFKMASEGSFDIGIGSISGSNEFSTNQAEESAETKKNFREAVRKASQEFNRERTLEINTTDASEFEHVSEGTLSNPNNEITVTYLLYELQRRYQISEHIHRVTPVILIAQDVPHPHEIDSAWLIANEWILKRVLLDDALKPALGYLTKGLASDEITLQILKVQWEEQKKVVEELKSTVHTNNMIRNNLRMRVESAIKTVADEEGFFEGLGEALFGDDKPEDEIIQQKREAAERALEFAQEDLAKFEGQLAQTVEAFQTATSEYIQALRKQANQRIAIDQLRIHVKDNILYYMQAIWSHEPPDQRYFRLYDHEVKVPNTASGGACTWEERMERVVNPYSGREEVRRRVGFVCPPPVLTEEPRRLGEIADLDRPLGFKGNYIIFPLKESIYLTSYMMQEYFDDYFGAIDPDPAGEYPVDELLEYAECAWHHPDATDEDRESLRSLIMERLSAPRRSSEKIVIPTGELFMEALPGKHPLLEDFKLKHRKMDVVKVNAEIREIELENLRKAARLEAGEREDPDIEKRVIVEGGDVDSTVDVGGGDV